MANSPEILIATLPSLTRRRLLVLLSTLMAGGIFPLPLVAGRAPSGKDSGGLSLKDFMHLSRALTGQADLDKELGRIYLDPLSQTPQGADALAELGKLAKSTGEMHDYAREDLQHIARDILLAWYTGATPLRVVLRWLPSRRRWRGAPLAIPPRPALCAGAMGHWGDKPKEP